MSAAKLDAEVLITGGGPVGIGLAIELGQRGVRTIVVERHREPQPIPKGQNLTQRTMEHLRAWGAEEALRAARTIPPAYGIGGLTAYGKLLGPWHYDWMQRGHVQAYYHCRNERLPQYATEAVLRRRAAELPNVQLLYGWSARSLVEQPDGISVEISNGTDARRLQAAYAVGCDGSRSLVRTQSGITQTLSDHDRLMVLLVFRSAELHRLLLERHPGKSFYCVLHPELQGYWRFFGRVDLDGGFFFHAPVPAGTTKDNHDFRALLHEAAGASFDVEFQHIGFWDLRFAIADRYRAGRVFIAGDAAHSHPPYGGYGVNSGLEDARNLGWKLAAALQGWAGAQLLDSYDLERRPVFASTMRDFIARSIEIDRDFVAAFDPALDRAAFEREWAARGSGAVSEVHAFEPHYEGSPVVSAAPGAGPCSAVGSHRFEARAGHHLAPARLASGRDVIDALGGGFTLLAFDADAAPLQPALDEATARALPLQVVHEAPSEESKRYAARLILVRPDHYVAWSSDAPGDVAGLRAALRKAVGGP